MKLKMKNQGHVLYLLGYLVYIRSQPDMAQSYLWLISLALAFFATSQLAPLVHCWLKSPKSGRHLANLAESAGGVLTLVFALSFIPKARFIETHVALFGLLMLTFLASRNLLPGRIEGTEKTPGTDIENSPAIGMPTNK